MGLAQEKLQPCLRNSNSTCLAETIAEIKTSPVSPCREFPQICQSLENSRKSLLEVESGLCPYWQKFDTTSNRNRNQESGTGTKINRNRLPRQVSGFCMR